MQKDRIGNPAAFSFAASVAEALLYQFNAYAWTAVDKGELGDEATYEQVLEGLQVSAPQVGPLVLKQLFSWKNEKLSEVNRSSKGDALVATKKQLIIELLFVEASLKLTANDATGFSPAQIKDLVVIAFDWILNADKNVENRSSPEITLLKDRMVLACSQLLGSVSPVALDIITDNFLNAITTRIKADATSQSRQEIYNLCHAMRFVRLYADTPQQLKASTNFLDRVHPLKHIAPDKKSRVQQALADMLTAILAPLTDVGDPGQFGEQHDGNLRKQWATTVTILQNEVLKWAQKQSKQAMSGFPAATVLTCIAEHQGFTTSVDNLVENLLKQLKEKRTASMALLCIIRTVSCFLRRMGPTLDANRLTKWVHKTVGPVVQSMARGLLTAPEHPELMRMLCSVITPHLPDYSLRSIVFELLQADGSNWEAPMSGMLCMLNMLCDGPVYAAYHTLMPVEELPATSIGLEAAAAAGAPTWQPSHQSATRLLELVRIGANPLDPYGAGQLLPKLEAAVGRVLVQCHTLHGYSWLTNSVRAIPETAPREKLGALPVFITVLHSIPFVMPDLWNVSKSKMAEDLAGYSIHAEPAVRDAAVEALQRIVHAVPAARDALIGGLAVHAIRLGDEFTDVVLDSVALLLTLMTKWLKLIPEEAAVAAAQIGSKSLPPTPAAFQTLHAVEGAALGLLCCTTINTRQLVVQVASTARDIHTQLILCQQQQQQQLANEASAASVASSVAGGPFLRTSSSGGRRRSLMSSAAAVNATLGSSLDTAVNAHRRYPSWGGPSSTRQSMQHSIFHGSIDFKNQSISLPPTPQSLTSPKGLLEGAPPTSPGGDHQPSSTNRYLADIIERSGDEIASRCYWDIGKWSDIWRKWRPVPTEGSDLLSCLKRRDSQDDQMRWARIVCDIASEAWNTNEQCAMLAHIEITSKLEALLSLDSNGRQSLPFEGQKAELACNFCLFAAAAPLMESNQLLYVSTTTSSDGQQQQQQRGMITRDLVKLLIASARSGSDAVQLTAILALGCSHKSYHAMVVQDAQALVDDYIGNSASGIGRGAKGSRAREDSRLVHAHVLRVLCSNLAPHTLVRDTMFREHVMEFINSTARLVSATAELTPELQPMRYCLASVAAAAAGQLAHHLPASFPPPLRKSLFGTFAMYCEEGRTPGLYRSELRRNIAAARSKIKDQEHGRQLEKDLIDASEALESAACLGMAAMLIGPIFDPEVKTSQGRVLIWADRLLSTPNSNKQQSAVDQQLLQPGGIQNHKMLASGHQNLASGTIISANNAALLWGPPKAHVAKTALANLLTSNPSDMASIYVDRSYSTDANIAAAYFQVLTEYSSTTNKTLPLEPHVVLSLVLHKVVDTRTEVREAALQMMSSVTGNKTWRADALSSFSVDKSTESLATTVSSIDSQGDGGGVTTSMEEAAAAVVIGSLAESQQQYQHYLSGRLAQEHPDLGEALTLEVLSRQRNVVSGAGDPQALLCLTPWLQYVHLGQSWQNQRAEALLRALYSVTAKQGGKQAYPVQKLWRTLAVNRRNVPTALDFLMERCLVESRAITTPGSNSQQQPCTVGKQAALYLSRTAPRQTIDYLVREAARQLDEIQVAPPDASSKPLHRSSEASSSRKILEYHHRPSSVTPTQQRLPQQQPLAAHAAAAVAAATASSSARPLTPASIALAIKRSTVDKLIKTGLAVVDHVAAVPAVLLTQSFKSVTSSGGGGGGFTSPRSSGSTVVVSPTSSSSTTSSSQHRPLSASLLADINKDDDSSSNTEKSSTTNTEPDRTILARYEVALCLLSEIACERDEELRPHLALLLHLAVLNADSTNARVRQESSMLLQCLLYSLACKHLESQGQGASSAADYARVSGVISYLQSLGTEESLWPREQPTLTKPWVASAAYVAAFVQIVADCFYFDSGLRETWGVEALRWACESASHHAASRSHQIYCALGPKLNALACTALLASLYKCLKSASAEGLDTAVEVLCTLRVLVTNTDPADLILYPQLLSACAALLSCSVVRVGELASALLLQLLDALDFSAPCVQQTALSVLSAPALVRSADGTTTVFQDINLDEDDDAENENEDDNIIAWSLGHELLSNVPEVDEDAAGGPWYALQQLVVKALFQPDTEALALEALTAVALQLQKAGHAGLFCNSGSKWYDAASVEIGLAAGTGMNKGLSGIESVFGDAEFGLAISLSASFSWICVYCGRGELAPLIASYLKSHAGACRVVGWDELAAVLEALAQDPRLTTELSSEDWVTDFAEILCTTLFPKYSRIVFQRLAETVKRGLPCYQKPALEAMTTIFKSSRLSALSSGLFADGQHLVETLTSAIGGPHAQQVLTLLQAMATYKGGDATVAFVTEDSTESILSWPQCMDDMGEGNRLCTGVLARAVAACPDGAALLKMNYASDGADISPVGTVVGDGITVGASPADRLVPFLTQSNWSSTPFD